LRISLISALVILLYFLLIGWAVFFLEKELDRLFGPHFIEVPNTEGRLLCRPGTAVRALLDLPAGR
jgi:hypothetical protein